MNPLYKVSDDREGSVGRRTITSLRSSSAPPQTGQVEELKIEPRNLRYLEKEFSQYLRTPPTPFLSKSVPSRRQLLAKLNHWIFEESWPAMSARRELARLSSPSQRGFRIVAVTSGKGGVGKTTLSVNLALALHQLDHRVLLVDADMGLGNVHVLVGKQPKRTLANFIAGQGSIVDAILPGPNGMDILYGGSGMPHLANLTRTQMQSFVHELTKLSDSYDFVVVDTAAGIAPNVLDYLSIADEILVVTTPDLSAILDAYGMIKAVRESHLPADIHSMVNQVADEKEAEAVFSRLSACTQKFLQFSPRPIGFVEKDERILQAGRRRVPYLIEDPTQKAAKQILSAADVFSSRRKRSIDR